MSNETTYDYTFVVVGGGLAGVGAALAAARGGIRTALIQDRPVLGGNSSSEIRVAPAGAGAYNAWARETGIVAELLELERAANHAVAANSRINRVTDMVLYDECRRQQDLDLHLNTSICDVSVSSDKNIVEIAGVQLGTEKRCRFHANVFADCTGDGTVAYLAGCESMKAEVLMGSSLLISAVDNGSPARFEPPPWAQQYSDESELQMRHHAHFAYGYYWLELGSPYDTIEENEDIRDVLLSHVYGVWDHVKNHCTEPGVRKKAENYVLDWVGVLPGKRESRRTVGDYVFSGDDIRNRSAHFDDVCYGGWYIDLHTDGGILATSIPPNPVFNELPDDKREEFVATVYPIPFRSLYARDIRNLFIPGRHFSADRDAFGSARVQCTTALMGEVAGTAASLCGRLDVKPADIAGTDERIRELQRALTRYDVFIPGVRDDDPDNLARSASASASSVFVPGFPEKLEETVTWKAPMALVEPISTKMIEQVAIWIETGSEETAVKLRAEELDDIWDNIRKPDEAAIYEGERLIPGGNRGWVEYNIEKQVRSRVLRFVLQSDQPIELGCKRPILPGSIRQKLERTRWHSRIDQEKEIAVPVKLIPAQKLFGPEQAVNGWARPVQAPNLWISDAEQTFPQWLELNWKAPVLLSRVILLFDNNLHREHRLRPGFYRAPECVKDYRIEAAVGGSFAAVWESRGNFIRRNECVFPQVKTDKLRIVVEDTNGDRSARIYEVKIYAK